MSPLRRYGGSFLNEPLIFVKNKLVHYLNFNYVLLNDDLFFIIITGIAKIKRVCGIRFKIDW